MCPTPLSTSNAYLLERTLPPLCGTPPSLMVGHHLKVKDRLFMSLLITYMRFICWYPSTHMFLCLLHQVILWRGRRKAPPDGQSSTLMYTNQRHMRPRGWLKASCMRWGCLLSTALACLSPVSTPNPSCLLVRNPAAFTLSIWTSVGLRFF